MAIRQWSAMAVFTVVLLVARSLAAVEVIPDSPVARDHLVTVRSSGFVWVIGIVKGEFVQVDCHKCDQTLVFTGAPGSYLVYGVENDQQFQRVVQIVDSAPVPPVPPPDPPGPDPPVPPPDPPEPPEPVPPPDIEKAYDIAPAVYQASLRVNTSVAELEKLATQYASAAKLLHEMRLTPAGAQRQLREIRQGLSGDWTAWETATEAAVLRAVERYGSGQLLWRDYCREIAGAIRAAADARMAAFLPRR